jgi:UDP-glucose 4-epimerase
MRIALSGGAGYVGSACLRLLAREGHTVLAIDDLSEGHRAALDGNSLEVANIQDTDRLARILGDFAPDAVIHFAASTYVGASVADPATYYRNNVTGSLSLLQAIRAAGVRRLLFSSTCAVYGAGDREAISEDVPLAPESPYARTKLAVEWMIADFARAYGMGYTLLRYFNAAGACSSGRFGEAHDPETHLIPLVLQVALGQREAITVFGTDYPTPDGTCIRDYVHVDDLASAHRLAIEATTPETAEVYNVGTGQGHSVKEIVDVCEEITGQPIDRILADRRPGDPPRLVADPSRLRSRLGWRPDHDDIRRIVGTAWEWHRSHPGGYAPHD